MQWANMALQVSLLALALQVSLLALALQVSLLALALQVSLLALALQVSLLALALFLVFVAIPGVRYLAGIMVYFCTGTTNDPSSICDLLDEVLRFPS